MFENETALVIGLGKSGCAAARVLLHEGASVFVTDERPADELASEIANVESLGASFVDPKEPRSVLERVTLAILSPGVPPSSPAVRRVRSANVPVIGEIELAYRLCKGPLIAITGTKGKSTTSALVGHVLRSCGYDVRVGGNIGEPLVEQVASAGAATWIVAEVSSFQLESIARFRPHIAVLLNLSPDHFDRYRSMDEYTRAKFRIFENQRSGDVAVLDLDDPLLRPLVPMLRQQGVDVRAFTIADRVAILGSAEFRLRGEHNVRNALAAALAATAVGCDVDGVRAAIAGFAPLPHRLAAVADVAGVRYVDDSKATTPAATIAALRSFREPVVLIAGGRAKGTPFDELGAAIDGRVKALVAIGEAALPLIEASPRTPHERVTSMQEAVERASRIAAPGDVVLLSPACASFDMFSSAEDRGDQFCSAVRSLREHSYAR
jgi:UDP-N-acetylmuramoylalanine--D-glutamate ligase